ncbi:MAG TPA: GNAT family N-acetyltransferase [Nocardioidaceae bacterium]|nr:GNAT family N-acetyltransferase [Nocardioidaceae bacterium]
MAPASPASPESAGPPAGGLRFPEDVPVLSDGVVTLRAHREDDVDRIIEQCNDPVSIAWTVVPVPYGREQAVEWVGSLVPAGWRGGSDLHLAIEYEGRFAGSAGLRPESQGSAEIAYGLHPDARGRGVAGRATQLLLDWAFGERGHSVVTWRAPVGNWPSRRVAWAAGFQFGPTIPRMLVQRSERRDAWTGWLCAGDSRRPKERWLEVPVLETGTLRLRAWADDDGDRLVEASNDPRLRRFIPHSPLPHTTAHVAAYLLRVHQAASEAKRLSWCVADRDTDEALGNIALFDFEADGSAQLGYWAHPKARGQGVLSQAARVVADWALAPEPAGFGLRRLYLFAAVSNAASRRVAEEAGFTHVGTERQAAPVGPGYEDNAVYDRLDEDPSTR